MGKTQLSLTFTHIRNYRKIEAIINYFVTMKVFIILCIIIGISASFSVDAAKRERRDWEWDSDGYWEWSDRRKRDVASGGNGEELKEADQEVGFLGGLFG